MDMESTLRKVIMAGIGAVSTAAEKSGEVLEQLAEKGEAAVSQGKVRNEQLCHDVKKVIKGNVSAVEEKVREASDKAQIVAALKEMSAADRAEILQTLRDMNGGDEKHAQ